MAAYEAVSKINIRPVNQSSHIDLRTTHLPDDAPADDFDPTQHRMPAKPIKPWMAYFNIIRTSFGPGVLGMPLAISQTGILLGPILSLAIGCLIVHSHFILLWCLNEVSRQLKIPYISYRYGFRLALLHGPKICKFMGNYGPTIIAVFMIMSQIATCSVILIFTSDSLRDVMDWSTSRTALLCLIVPFLLLECTLRTLNIMGYVAMITNFVTLTGVILIYYQIFAKGHSEMELVSLGAMKMTFAIGTFLYNLTAVGVILSIDKALVDPSIMTSRYGVINVGMLCPTIFGTIFGSLGYWSFGTMEENILRSLPFDEITSMAAISLYSIAVAFAYPIQSYPCIQICIEVIKNLKKPPSKESLAFLEPILRVLFFVTTGIICYVIPFQAAFVAFVGNFCTIQLALVFPALMELCLLYPSRFGRYKIYFIKDLSIIIAGTILWLFGIYHCGYLIYIRMLAMDASNCCD